MKKYILNLGAIFIAFIIGITINNACADSLENMSDTELRILVAQLQQEINSLKDRVADLEKHSGSSGSSSNAASVGDCGAFVVDGVRFAASGSVVVWYNKIKSQVSTTTTTINGEVSQSTSVTNLSDTQYDSKGRIVSSHTDYDGYVSDVVYQYEYKKITSVSTTTYKTTDYKKVLKTVTEYE